MTLKLKESSTANQIYSTHGTELTELFVDFLEWRSKQVHVTRLCSVKHCRVFIVVIILLKWLQFQLVVRHCYQPILASFAFLPVITAQNPSVGQYRLSTHCRTIQNNYISLTILYLDKFTVNSITTKYACQNYQSGTLTAMYLT